MSAPTLTRLDEVVRYWDAMPHAEPLTLVGDQYADFLALIAVARDIVGGAEERQWCETHKQDGDTVGCLGAHMIGTPCRMVSVLVWRAPDSEQVSPTTH